jgi:ABC-type sugar transport system ATPase subunit
VSDLVIDARGVGKVFGKGDDRVEALSGITLQIRPREFISLIGPSGCGKSTLLRLIGDLTSPTTGQLTINGKPPNTARTDRDYGIVFQKATLLDWRTVSKNVELPQVVLDNGSTLGASHQAWQLNEILGLIFPATNGIGVMNEDLWNQTVEISTSQIPELEGAEISPDAFRTDIATEAVARLEADGFDVSGEGYEPQTIELEPGGE